MENGERNEKAQQNRLFCTQCGKEVPLRVIRKMSGWYIASPPVN